MRPLPDGHQQDTNDMMSLDPSLCILHIKSSLFWGEGGGVGGGWGGVPVEEP